MGNYNVLTSILASILMFVNTGVSFSGDIITDPDVQKEVSSDNWKPGSGKYTLFGSRGTVIESNSSVDIVKTSSVRAGSVLIEQANISATHSFTMGFSDHPYTEHSPGTKIKSASNSTTIKTDDKNVSINLNWNGERVHPANGYDGEQGGGYPVPIGAVDYHNYTVTGIASGMYFLSSQEQQKYEVAPVNIQRPVYHLVPIDVQSGLGPTLDDQYLGYKYYYAKNKIVSGDPDYDYDNPEFYNNLVVSSDSTFGVRSSVVGPDRQQSGVGTYLGYEGFGLNDGNDFKPYSEYFLETSVDFGGGVITGIPEAITGTASLPVDGLGYLVDTKGDDLISLEKGLVDIVNTVNTNFDLGYDKYIDVAELVIDQHEIIKNSAVGGIKNITIPIKQKGSEGTKYLENKLEGVLGYKPGSPGDKAGKFFSLATPPGSALVVNSSIKLFKSSSKTFNIVAKNGNSFKLTILDNGKFKINDATGYPDAPKKAKLPQTELRLLPKDEYDVALTAKNKENKRIRDKIKETDPDLLIDKVTGKKKEIHEIIPVKFGGSPTDPKNKILLTKTEHGKYSSFWLSLQHIITKKNEKPIP